MLWTLRLLTPAAAIPVAWKLFSTWRHLEIFPDFLRKCAGTYFERAGLCFAPVVELAAGHPVLAIYFQNRYARRAIAPSVALPAFLRPLFPRPRHEYTAPQHPCTRPPSKNFSAPQPSPA